MADAEIVSLRAKLASRPRSDDYRQRRRDFDARSLEYGVASDVTVEPVTANGVRAEWTSTPQDGSDAALLLSTRRRIRDRFAPGDIQFVNNHVIYHARSAFEDDDEGHDRLLLRLWLSMPNSRALPAGHEVLWRAVEAGTLRGGIGQSGVPV